jgi:hypothetical protein
VWIVQEFRRDRWVGISAALSEAEAHAAFLTLQSERPWRAYRVTPAWS